MAVAVTLRCLAEDLKALSGVFTADPPSARLQTRTATENTSTSPVTLHLLYRETCSLDGREPLEQSPVGRPGPLKPEVLTEAPERTLTHHLTLPHLKASPL